MDGNFQYAMTCNRRITSIHVEPRNATNYHIIQHSQLVSIVLDVGQFTYPSTLSFSFVACNPNINIHTQWHSHRWYNYSVISIRRPVVLICFNLNVLNKGDAYPAVKRHSFD